VGRLQASPTNSQPEQAHPLAHTREISTVAELREASIAGEKKVFENVSETYHRELKTLLEKAVRTLMPVTAEPAVTEMFQFWKNLANSPSKEGTPGCKDLA
jgi:uncharacterized protein YeaO (DUF488 family)